MQVLRLHFVLLRMTRFARMSSAGSCFRTNTQVSFANLGHPILRWRIEGRKLFDAEDRAVEEQAQGRSGGNGC